MAFKHFKTCLASFLIVEMLSKSTMTSFFTYLTVETVTITPHVGEGGENTLISGKNLNRLNSCEK